MKTTALICASTAVWLLMAAPVWAAGSDEGNTPSSSDDAPSSADDNDEGTWDHEPYSAVDDVIGNAAGFGAIGAAHGARTGGAAGALGAGAIGAGFGAAVGLSNSMKDHTAPDSGHYRDLDGDGAHDTYEGDIPDADSTMESGGALNNDGFSDAVDDDYGGGAQTKERDSW